METWDAIRARRNVRRFEDRPIPSEHLDRILEAGRRAPSARNRQPWDFVVVTDRAQLADLAKVWQGAGHVAQSAATVALVIPKPETEGELRHTYYDLGQATMAMALAAAEAVEEVAGFAPGVKWPNDLVWPGDGSAPDRKLAGILAEADWLTGSSAASGVRRPAPEERVVVVVGIGINVAWPEDLPEELADVAVACNHVTDVPVDREDLLAALLVRLGHWYGRLVDGDRAALVAAWRERSATLGRRVRIDLGPDDVVGTAVDITERGHLVVDTLEGERRTFAVGDVVHLRPELA